MIFKLYPSLIAADLLDLRTAIKELESSCDGFHLDLMDHHFVPNLTWGPDFVNSIACATELPLWVHLMVTNPSDIVEQLQLRTQDLVTLHYESFATPKLLLDLVLLIKKTNSKVGIAVSPRTEISLITDLLVQLDQVLIMSVEPGFSGQQFLPATYAKIEQLLQARRDQNLNFRIAVDGGVNLANINKLVQAGVQDLAIGAAIFNSFDTPEIELQRLRG
ncbi:MAG TPA: ribulose-phosphate 3-epimerase [Candidatus Babeliales bacterium]|nr:ribulose-phosphate 3-epimerase [Candidatus Babeliales bacterium]